MQCQEYQNENTATLLHVYRQPWLRGGVYWFMVLLKLDNLRFGQRGQSVRPGRMLEERPRNRKIAGRFHADEIETQERREEDWSRDR